MIESMTGYGSGRAHLSGNTVDVTLRSLNSRSFKLTMRLPETILGAQQELEELIKGALTRGTIHCHVELNGPLAASWSLDEEMLLDYCRKLARLAKKTGFPEDIRIEPLAALPGVLRENKAAGSQLRALLSKAAGKALSSLVTSRRREGAQIEKELRDLLAQVNALCGKIQRGRNRSLPNQHKKLSARVNEILSNSSTKVTPAEVAREAAILVERSDIAEELQRLGIHAQQMAKVLSGRKPAGRQLGFIAQEMLREANTMSAKTLSSRLVVPLLELKRNIDRIREQAQNVQ